MYQINGNCAYINGLKGAYNKKIDSPSVCYGRNAIKNLQEYQKDLHTTPPKMPDLSNLSQLSQEAQDKKLKDFEKALKKIKKITPIHYQCRYMPQGRIDEMALMGAAYEILGKRTSISTQEMSENLRKETSLAFKSGVQACNAQPMDINKDGKIDLTECASALLFADGICDETGKFDAKNIDGTITDTASNCFPYLHLDYDSKKAKNIYRILYSTLYLGNAKEKFLSNENNLI